MKTTFATYCRANNAGHGDQGRGERAYRRQRKEDKGMAGGDLVAQGGDANRTSAGQSGQPDEEQQRAQLLAKRTRG